MTKWIGAALLAILTFGVDAGVPSVSAAPAEAQKTPSAQATDVSARRHDRQSHHHYAYRPYYPYYYGRPYYYSPGPFFLPLPPFFSYGWEPW